MWASAELWMHFASQRCGELHAACTVSALRAIPMPLALTVAMLTYLLLRRAFETGIPNPASPWRPPVSIRFNTYTHNAHTSGMRTLYMFIHTWHSICMTYINAHTQGLLYMFVCARAPESTCLTSTHFTGYLDMCAITHTRGRIATQHCSRYTCVCDCECSN